MDKEKQGMPYPPTQGFAPTGFPQTGFAGPAYPAQQQQPMYGGAGGAPPPMGFIYLGSQGGPGPTAGHTGYPMPPTDHTGPKPYSNESGSSSDLHGIDFSEKTIRMAFIRKVYGILSFQLMITTTLIALFVFEENTKMWVQKNTGFIFVSYIIAIILLLALACCENLRRKSPHNIILLALFTLTYGTVIGLVASQYRAQDVVTAAGITTVVCVGLTIFAFQTKYDFTMMGGALFVCCLVLFLFSILAIFLGPTFRLFLAGAGALLFSLYLVYDTQLMIGGKHKMSISPEEYVMASLNIYLDIIMIFIYILRLVGSRD